MRLQKLSGVPDCAADTPTVCQCLPNQRRRQKLGIEAGERRSGSCKRSGSFQEIEGLISKAESGADKDALVTRILNAVWDGVILGNSKWNPDRSCYELAEEYKQSGRTPDGCVKN
jgi:hypothetical protein